MRNIATKPNKTKGVLSPKTGERLPLVEAATIIFINRIRMKAKAIAKARFAPIPPLFFLHERVTPMIVNIIKAIGLNNR